MAVERPKYSVEIREAPYEIRDYPATIVATVHVDGGRSEAVNAGFRILAGYIFGGNLAQDKIAMTAPVEQNAMPAGWAVRFTMPAAYTMATLPTPKDARVHLAEVPHRRVAAIEFSGFWSDANLHSHEAQLLQWVRTKKLAATSTPAYAFYDPPWTPWFLRTIEILVDIAPDHS